MKKIFMMAVAALMFGTALAQNNAKSADVATRKGGAVISLSGNNTMLKVTNDIKQANAPVKVVRGGFDIKKKLDPSKTVATPLKTAKPVAAPARLGKQLTASQLQSLKTVNAPVKALPFATSKQLALPAKESIKMMRSVKTSKVVGFSQALTKHELSPMPSNLVMRKMPAVAKMGSSLVASKALAGKTMLSADALKGAKAVSKINMGSTTVTRIMKARKAAPDALKESYNATGQKWEGQQNFSPVSWEMAAATATAESGEKIDVLLDVIPSLDGFESLYPQGVPVAYTVEGSTMIIEPQIVATTQSGYNAVLCDANTEDGVIRLTLGSDGSLTAPSDAVFVYAAIATETTFSIEAIKGYFEAIATPAYTYDGQSAGGNTGSGDIDPGFANFQAVYKYDAKGDVYNQGSSKWNMYLGGFNYNGQLYDCCVDIIPNIFDAECIPLYAIADNEEHSLTVPAQWFAELPDQTTGQTIAWVFAFNTKTADGSIKFVLDDEGNLTYSADSEIAYASFTSQEFDPTFETLYAAYEIVNNITYTKTTAGSGGNTGGGGATVVDPGFEGFVPQYMYDATGVDYESQKNVSWNAYIGTYTYDGESFTAFVDAAPNIFAQYGFDCIPLYAEISGNTLTVEPQVFAQGSDSYVLAFNGNSEDGVFTFTIGSDGKLSSASSVTVMYGAFSSEEFDVNSYLGYYQITDGVTYTLRTSGGGSQGGSDNIDPGYAGFTAKYKYNATGTAVIDDQGNTGTKSWNAYFGTYDYSAGAAQCVVNPLPNPFSGVECIPFKGTLSGDKFVCEPMLIGKGDGYSIYLFGDDEQTSGAVTFTLDSNGNLSLPSNVALVLGAFVDEFDPNLSDDTYLGYAGLSYGITYKLSTGGSTGGGDNPGGNADIDPGYENFTATYKYDATGNNVLDDNGNTEAVKWNAYLGKYSYQGQQFDAMVDVIPNVFSDYFDCVPLECVINGSTLYVPAQPFAKTNNGYLFAFDANSEDGTVTLTIGSDGKITAPSGQAIAYGVFSGTDFDSTFNTYQGTYCIVQDINYSLVTSGSGGGGGGGSDTPSETAPKNVSYMPEGVNLFINMSPTFYGISGYVYEFLPAYAPVAYKNLTTEKVGGFTWSVGEMVWNDVAGEYVSSNEQVGTDRDFIHNTEGGKIYGPVSLVGYNGSAESASFEYGHHYLLDDYPYFYAYAGMTSDGLAAADGTNLQVSKACPDNDIMLMSPLATPDVNQSGYNVTDIVIYEGKPAAPLYTTGLTFWLYNASRTKDFNLVCEIRHATRDSQGKIVLGDLIATSNAKYKDFFVSGNSGLITFKNFYVYDVDGLTISKSHLFLDEEYAVVIKNWNNGTFSGIPISEAEYDDHGMPHFGFKMAGSNNINMFNGYYVHLFLGYVDAAYGYLHTEDATTIPVSANGGVASIRVKPMVYEVGSNGAPRTRLELDETTPLPEWLSYSFENEDYSTDDYKFDLTLTAQPMPADVPSRSADLLFWQEGALLKVKVNQTAGSAAPGVDAIETVTFNAATPSTGLYNIAGQKVANDFKGLVIANGKKVMQK